MIKGWEGMKTTIELDNEISDPNGWYVHGDVVYVSSSIWENRENLNIFGTKGERDG